MNPIPHAFSKEVPSYFVDLEKYIPGIKLQIDYATANNFLEKPFYEIAKAFLVQEAAESLLRVNQDLRPLGFGLLIFDAYRPWSVTQEFWDLAGARNPVMQEYLANPKSGSVHNRGCAVDLSLFHLATGGEAIMPSAFDEMNEKAHVLYEPKKGSDDEKGFEVKRNHRSLLQATMSKHGFKGIKNEWWHFNYVGNEGLAFEKYPVENFSLTAIWQALQNQRP